MRTFLLPCGPRLNRRLTCLAILIPLVGGCKSRPSTIGLEGEITFDGRAIEAGSLELTPTDGTEGPSAGATIVNGRYAVPARWGVSPNGVYLVRVTALRKTGRTEPNRSLQGGPPIETLENFIPPRYNSESTVKLKISELTDKSAANFQLGRSSAGAPR
jgi:hypothetical protein